MTERELDQLKLISEYIKFHIGLYLATPPVLMVVAQGLKVEDNMWWIAGVCAMILIYIVSGISAAWFMGKYINSRWNEALLSAFADEAYSVKRRLLHHWLYWLGLLVGLSGLFIAVGERLLTGQGK